MNAADDLAVLARVTASLVVVLALAVLAARFARRAGVRGGGAGLRVVERTGLSREASLAVVEVAGRGLVLGVTAHGVTLLTELEPGQLEAAAAAAGAGSVAAGASSAAGGPARREAGQIRRVVVGSGLGSGLSSGLSSGLGSGLSPAPGPRGTGSVLDPRTWRQAVDALRDLTARRR